MFFFGSPEDQAAIYLTAALDNLGPALEDKHRDELDAQQLKIALAYARIAYEAAQTDGAPDDTLKVLLAEHDAIFEALAVADEKFRGRVLGTEPGHIIWLGGYSEETISKYKALASAN